MVQETGLISCEIASLLEKCSATELQSLLAIFEGEKETVEPPVVQSQPTTATSRSETKSESTPASAKAQQQGNQKCPEDLLQSAAMTLEALDSVPCASAQAPPAVFGVSSAASSSSERQVHSTATGSSISHMPHGVCREQKPALSAPSSKQLAPSMDGTANACKSIVACDLSSEALAPSKNEIARHTAEDMKAEGFNTKLACDQGSKMQPPPINEIDNHASLDTTTSSHGESSRTKLARDETTEVLPLSATDTFKKTCDRNPRDICETGDQIAEVAVPSENVLAEISSTEIVKPIKAGDELCPIASTAANDDVKLTSKNENGNTSMPIMNIDACEPGRDGVPSSSKIATCTSEDAPRKTSHAVKACNENSESVLPSETDAFTSCSADYCDQGDASIISKVNDSKVQSASAKDNSDLLALLDSCRSVTPEQAAMHGALQSAPDTLWKGEQTRDVEVAIESVQPVSNMQRIQALQVDQQPIDPFAGSQLLQGSGPQVLDQVNRLASSFAPNTTCFASLLSAKSAEVAALQAKLASLHESVAQQDATLSELGTNLEKKVGVMRRKRSDLEFQQFKLEECMSENFSLEETCMVLNARFARLSKEVESESIALQERPSTSSSMLPIQSPSGLTRSLREKRSSSKG